MERGSAVAVAVAVAVVAAACLVRPAAAQVLIAAAVALALFAASTLCVPAEERRGEASSWAVLMARAIAQAPNRTA